MIKSPSSLDVAHAAAATATATKNIAEKEVSLSSSSSFRTLSTLPLSPSSIDSKGRNTGRFEDDDYCDQSIIITLQRSHNDHDNESDDENDDELSSSFASVVSRTTITTIDPYNIKEQTENYQDRIEKLETQLQLAQRKAVRQDAMIVLYQDELRHYHYFQKKDGDFDDNAADDLLQKEYKSTRWALRQVKDRATATETTTALKVLEDEYSAVHDLYHSLQECHEWKQIAIQNESKVVMMEFEQQVLERSLQLQSQQTNQIGRERDTLEMKYSQLESTMELLRQRLFVAEHERNTLRRIVLLTPM